MTEKNQSKEVYEIYRKRRRLSFLLFIPAVLSFIYIFLLTKYPKTLLEYGLYNKLITYASVLILPICALFGKYLLRCPSCGARFRYSNPEYCPSCHVRLLLPKR